MIRVALLETSASDEPGSMRRYGDMLVEALRLAQPAGEPGLVNITRISLAPSTTSMSRVPRRMRTWVQHAMILWNSLWISKSAYDLFHILDGSRGFVVYGFPRNKTICTSHDVIPWIQSQCEFPVASPGVGARWIINRSLGGLARSAMVISVSQATERDLRRAGLTQTQISVIHHAIPTSFQARLLEARDRSRSEVTPTDSYIFHIGNNGFYKNRAGVVRVFERLQEQRELKLIMAGPPPSAELQTLVNDLGLQERVTFQIDPSDGKLQELYAQARLLLFPSYYEGFGWPPLEAMACGCPVVASNRGSLPEIVGDAGLIAEPDDLDALANHCRTLLNNPETALKYRQSGYERVQQFSMRKMGSKVLEVYKQVHSSHRVEGETMPCTIEPQGSVP